jgi:hypothetical protein
VASPAVRGIVLSAAQEDVYENVTDQQSNFMGKGI